MSLSSEYHLHHFAELQKDLTNQQLKNPAIKVGLHSVRLEGYPFGGDIAWQLFLWTASFILFSKTEFLFGAIFILCASLYFFYFLFIGLNVCTIDFASKTLHIRNRIFVFNWLRKLFGTRQTILFSELRKIDYKEGFLLDRFNRFAYRSRYLLVIDSLSDAGIIASQFKKEADARKIALILQKFLLINERIIA
jgi:hypothetical protein